MDRGHREVPIRADAVGLEIATDWTENIKVRVRPVDPVDEIVRVTRPGDYTPPPIAEGLS